MSRAGEAALAYFERVRARDPQGVADLFSPGGELVMPDGRALVGREAIAAAYVQVFAGTPPDPTVVKLIEAGETCAAEIAVARGDTVGRVIDVFELGADGLLASVRIYRQGP